MQLCTCSTTLREEHWLRVLRRIFGPKGTKATGGWRKLLNGAIYTPYTSTKNVRVLNLRMI
jgi:hypothetical protein